MAGVLRFYRFRLVFQAEAEVSFPAEGTANLIRGGLGKHLHRLEAPEVYEWLFAPRQTGGPSGLADPPRPFVLRANDLNGKAFAPGATFAFEMNVFELNRPVRSYFERAFQALAAGLGARLLRVEQLDLGTGTATGPQSISLDARGTQIESVTVRFVTPTEFKAEGKLCARPEFFILAARARDRISSLCSIYGEPLPSLDFRGMGERARQVLMTRCELTWHRETRTSRRTGQTHPMGGFTGEADYRGDLDEFLPWLEAARWTGVGRQTAWGKGEISLVNTPGRF